MTGQRCKGTRDFSPEEMKRFRLIEGVFRECCMNLGYEEVRTPTLEYLHLFTSTGTLTPSRLSRVYSFLDWDGWSGERVVLRPDGTIPIARLYIDTMEDRELARLFYVTNVFVFEETGEETRERWQCGAELVGAGSTVADAELIVLALGVLKKLRFQGVELRLSHAGLIRALLAEFEPHPGEQSRMFDQILDGDVDTLAEVRQKKPELSRALAPLLDLKGKTSGFLKNMKALLNQHFPEMSMPLNNFIEVVDLLDALDIEYQIDITSGRGFEYYTGMMFQFIVNDEHIGGGGRYDALIPSMGGRDIPASGFAYYIDRLMKLVRPETATEPVTRGILIKTGTQKASVLKEAFNLASQLHEAGYPAAIYLGSQEQADPGWIVNIQEKEPQYILTDRINDNKYELQTVVDVVKAVQGVR